MINKFESRNSKTFYIVRGFIIFILFFLISKITSLTTKWYAVAAGNDGILRDFPNFAIYILIYIAELFIFNSCSLAFATYDKDEMLNFLERVDGDLNFISELKDILKTPHLLFEILTSLILTTIVAVLGGFPEIGGIFFETANRSGWFPPLLIIPFCFLSSVFSKYEARRYWQKLYKENNIDKIDSPVRFIVKLAFIILAYPLIFPLAPLIIFPIISIANIIISFANALTALVLILVVLLFILLVFAITILRCIIKRKNFLKKLNYTSAQSKYTLTNLKNPYKSFFNTSKMCSFDLKDETNTYHCLVINTLRRSTPLIFTSPTSAFFEHRLGTKNHHISLNNHIDFYLHGDGIKIIIIAPSPKHVFVLENNRSRRLSSADKIWNFTVHDDTSFIGSMDRKCLDRSNSLNY